MQSVSPISLLSARTLVIDLIGDLDAQLVRSFSEALDRLAPHDDGIVVRLKHLSNVQHGGVAALASVLGEQKRAGRSVCVAADGSRLRGLLRTARVPVVDRFERGPGVHIRHVMIVRNGNPTRDCA